MSATMKLRQLKLKQRMILILGIMALIQTGFIGLFAMNRSVSGRWMSRRRSPQCRM